MLSLDGFKVPVHVKTKQTGDSFAINLYSHDELFDYEKYVVGDDSFSLAEGALETYNPPIPLLVFPFHFQKPPRDWSGTLSSEREPHPAHANIAVSQDDIAWNGSSSQTFHVTVVIFLDDVNNPSLAKRTLEFWFSPEDGLLQRKFDNTSVREPVAE